MHLHRREDLLQRRRRVGVTLDLHAVSGVAPGELHEPLSIGDNPYRGGVADPAGGDIEDATPSTPATVYELTERGYAVKAAILELARWGRPPLRDAPEDQLPDSALSLGLDVVSLIHAGRGIGVECCLSGFDSAMASIGSGDTNDVTCG